MLVTIEVSDRFIEKAHQRKLTPEQAVLQVFNLGYGDWKSRGRNPIKEKQIRLKKKDQALQERRLIIREKALAEREAKAALKAFKTLIGPGLTVTAPDGRRVVLEHPNEPGTAWEGIFEDGSGKVMLPTKLMRP